MSFLTSKQMAGLRTSVNGILTQTGTLTHRTLTSDGYGGQSTTETTSTEACRWIPFTAQERLQVGATPEMVVGHILFAYGTTVTVKDSIVIDSITYEITGIESSIDSALITTLATRV